MSKFTCIVVFFLIFSICFIKNCQAARNITITADKDALFGDEQVSLSTQLSGFTDGETIYIKGAFYQDGTTNYFGYTKNNNDWVKNGISSSLQWQVKIGGWDGQLIAKSDFSDSGYKGEGTYKFKVGFYYTTSGGNLSSVNWSTNILDIYINEPDPTPTPAPSPVATSASSQTTAKLQSPSPKLSPSAAVKSPTPSSLPSPEILGAKSQTSNINLASAAPSTQPAPTQLKSSKSVKIASILVGIGLIMLIISVSLFLWYRKLHSLQAQSNQQDYESDNQ